MSDDADFSQLADDLAPEDLRMVLSVFAGDVKRLTGKLSAAAAAGDPVGFRRVAHGLAGAAGAVGAKGLEHACRTAMSRSDLAADDLPVVAAHVDELADQSLAKLNAFIARLDKAESARG